MEDFLVMLLEVFVEVVLEIAGEAILDLAARASARLLGKLFEVRNPVAAASAYLALGAFAGWLSLFVFPYAIVKPSRIHGISLIIGPVVTGLFMSLIGSIVRR